MRNIVYVLKNDWALIFCLIRKYNKKNLGTNMKQKISINRRKQV